MTCLGMYSGRIGEPVVAMDDIEVERACNHTRGNRVVVDFLEKIRGIFAGELYATEVVGAHIVEVGIYMVAETEIKVGGHEFAYTCIDIVTVDIAPCNRHLRVADYMSEASVFVAIRLGNDKGYVHVATLPHTTGEAVAGSAETAEDVRREFPTEH